MDENRSFNFGKSQLFLFGFVFISLTIAAANSSCNAQILGAIRSSARAASQPAPDPPKRSKRDRENRRHDDDDDDSNILGNILGAVLFGSGSESESSSNSSMGNNLSEPDHQGDIDYEIYSESSSEPELSFSQFPYETGDGIMLDSNVGQASQGKFAFWYGTDFDDIDSWNTQIRFDNSDTIGFDFQWTHLREKLAGLPSDSLNLMDFNLTVPWVKSESMIVRVGGGINLLSDSIGTEVDYNLTMSADFFPTKPVVIGFEIDHGEIGSTHQTHLLSTVGLNWRQVEFMTGYEYRKIGLTEIKGPILGMRLWW